LAFNTGVSFQLPQPVPATARAARCHGADFAAKLGVRSDGRPMVVHKAGAEPSARMALYAWGLHAGQHLSQVPHAFQAYTAKASATPPEENQVASLTVVRPGTPVTLTKSPVATIAVAHQRAEPSGALYRDAEPSPVLHEKAECPGGTWRARRWQLLKRPDGLSLLVRDYHLSCAEQADLAAALSARLPACWPSLECIWLNGRIIWQAEAVPTQLIAGGPHGD